MGSKPSMDALKQIDYIAAETHWWAKQKEKEVLQELSKTHIVESAKYAFWATKK